MVDGESWIVDCDFDSMSSFAGPMSTRRCSMSTFDGSMSTRSGSMSSYEHSMSIPLQADTVPRGKYI